MSPSPYLLLPLGSALVYVIGTLLIKRGVDGGVDVWRTTFIANIAIAIAYQPLLLLGGTFHAELLWQPATVGLLFLAGQLLTYASIDGGHVSVATPVLSLKVVLVALFTSMLLTQNVLPSQWVGAGLSTLAIALLNRRDTQPQAGNPNTGRSIVMAGGAALSYAMFDVLVQKWSPAWGAGMFLPVMLGFVALMACILIPRFPAPLKDVPRGPLRWILAGSFISGAQSVVFVYSIAAWGNGTAANVVYSSRGLWSVLLVWQLGHWFGNRENEIGPSVFRWRIAGASLMMAAVALVLW